MNSYRTTGENNDNFSMANQAFEDQVSLRSLPMTQHNPQLSSVHSSQAQHLNPPRSMSPVSSMSGDELSTGHGGRRSQRRRVLDKQVWCYLIIVMMGRRVWYPFRVTVRLSKCVVSFQMTQNDTCVIQMTQHKTTQKYFFPYLINFRKYHCYWRFLSKICQKKWKKKFWNFFLKFLL